MGGFPEETSSEEWTFSNAVFVEKQMATSVGPSSHNPCFSAARKVDSINPGRRISAGYRPQAHAVLNQGKVHA
jgi:hypothetical protein